jgi:hypothetical protein
VTYFNAGLRVYDIANPEAPRSIAYWVPEAPPDREAPQINDLLVDADGTIFTTDRYAGGLYVLVPEDEVRATIESERL